MANSKIIKKISGTNTDTFRGSTLYLKNPSSTRVWNIRTNYTLGTPPSNLIEGALYGAKDQNDEDLGFFQITMSNDGKNSLSLTIKNKDNNNNIISHGLTFSINKSGVAKVISTHPQAWADLIERTELWPRCIELYPPDGTTNGGYIDFHYGGGNKYSPDYTSRIIGYDNILSLQSTVISITGEFRIPVGKAMACVGTKATHRFIDFIDNTGTVDGNGVILGSSGMTVVGGGESGQHFKTQYANQGGLEYLILANDGNIDFYTNCQNGLSGATHTSIAGDTFSGKAMYLKSFKADGAQTDDWGNLKPQTSDASATFQMKDYNGNMKLKYTWSSGYTKHYGEIETSTGAIAIGSKEVTQTTIPTIVDAVRVSSGLMGSFNLGTAYTLGSVTMPAKWYNFIWIPHRKGGTNNVASGDNCNYGNLLCFGMTGGDTDFYLIHYNNNIVGLKKIA